MTPTAQSVKVKDHPIGCSHAPGGLAGWVLAETSEMASGDKAALSLTSFSPMGEARPPTFPRQV